MRASRVAPAHKGERVGKVRRVPALRCLEVGGRRRQAGGRRREESAVASDRGAEGGRRWRAARVHFWTSRHRQIGHTPAGCALVHGEVGGVCRSRLLVPCVVDSTRPASSALGGSPGRFTPPMREQMPRPETNPPPVQVQCGARRPTRRRCLWVIIGVRPGTHFNMFKQKLRRAANPTPASVRWVTRQIRATPFRQLVAGGGLGPRACTRRCRDSLGSRLACRWSRTNRL